jgi:hypothetical protein
VRQVSIHELTEDVLRRSYDRGSLMRGRTYAAEDRVRVVSAAPGLLVGLATGNASQPYRVQVAWAARGASISVSDDCTCPVGLACKHAVALILTAQRSARATPAPGSPGSPGSPGHVGVTDPARLTGPERQFADWRRVFRDLRDEHAVDPDETPIAIEFAISTIKPSRYVPSPRPDVTLRPLRRGSKGAWIRTGVSWRDLESGYAYALRDIDPVHRNAARALLMSLTTNRYNTPATLPLGPAQPDVWQMLRRLVDAGVALVGERGGPTEVALAAVPARLAVDLVDAGDGAVRVSARLEHDDAALTADASAVGLLGDPPHGLFVVNGAQLTLVPFAQRLPRAAGRLLATPLVVPPADVDELLDAYVPLMAQHGRVGSSDGSIEVVLSEFVGVVAQVRRVVPDVAELTWGLRYRRGQRITTHPLAPTSAVGRDRDAEVAAIDALELPVHLLASIVWPDGRPRATVASGRDTVTLMAEVVPWLLERGQVLVEVDSELPALREALGDPLIELSVSDGAADTDGADGQRTDWFDLSVQVSVDGEDVEFASLFAALSRDDEVLFLSSGSWLRLDRPEFARLRELIGEASGLADGAVGDGVRINRFQTSWWDELAGLGVIQHQSERWQRSVAQLGSLTAPARIEPPEGLQAELRDYQREGFDWLVFLAEHGLGGVLADDMGLGKTVQTLALMLHSLDRKPSARFLVVAPTSVVENWHREASQFAPSIEVATIAETARRRGRSLAEAVGSAALVVTSYALFRIEFDEYQALGWDLLLLDEAQFVKNHQGKTYQCARRLERRHEAGDHRHPAREQPHGPVVAAVDHRARPLPRPQAVLRGVPQADRERPCTRAADDPASPDRPVDAPTHQGRGAHRAAAEDRADDRGRAEREARSDLPDPAAAPAPEGARAGGRRPAAPVRDPEVAHAPATARASTRAWSTRSTLRSARPSSTAWSTTWLRWSPRVTGRWCSASSPATSPGSEGSPRRRRHRPLIPRRSHPSPRRRPSPGSRTATRRSSSSA